MVGVQTTHELLRCLSEVLLRLTNLSLRIQSDDYSEMPHICKRQELKPFENSFLSHEVAVISQLPPVSLVSSSEGGC